MTDVDPRLDQVAALLADPSRSAMLLTLMGGRQVPASELAQAAHVTPATASEHLAKLVAGGLVTVRPQGRHRYFALSDPTVAAIIEDLLRFAPRPAVRSLRGCVTGRHLAMARMCYDHLAGALALRVVDALLAAGWVEPDAELSAFRITQAGHGRFGAWGLTLRPGGRPVVRSCLDWSERRPHLAGQLGSELAAWLFRQGWATRRAPGRIVDVTSAGAQALRDRLGIAWPPRDPP